MTVTGFILLGGVEAFIFVPLMPLIIEAVIENERKNTAIALNPNDDFSEEFEETLNDKASSLFQGA